MVETVPRTEAHESQQFHSTSSQEGLLLHHRSDHSTTSRGSTTATTKSANEFRDNGDAGGGGYRFHSTGSELGVAEEEAAGDTEAIGSYSGGTNNCKSRGGGEPLPQTRKRALDKVDESSDELYYASADQVNSASMVDETPADREEEDEQDLVGSPSNMYGNTAEPGPSAPPPTGSGNYGSDSQDQPPSKRTLQNRKAQREFRQRRASYLRDLEEKVRRFEAGRAEGATDTQQRLNHLTQENQYLRAMIARLQNENAAYRTRDLQYQSQIQQQQHVQQQQQQSTAPRHTFSHGHSGPSSSNSAPPSMSYTSQSSSSFTGTHSPLRHPLQLDSSGPATSNAASGGSLLDAGSAHQNKRDISKHQRGGLGPLSYAGMPSKPPLDNYAEERRSSSSSVTSTAAPPPTNSQQQDGSLRSSGESWFYPEFADEGTFVPGDVQAAAQSASGGQHRLPQQSQHQQPSSLHVPLETPPSDASSSSWHAGPYMAPFPSYNQPSSLVTQMPYAYPLPPPAHPPSHQQQQQHQPSAWPASYAATQPITGPNSYPDQTQPPPSPVTRANSTLPPGNYAYGDLGPSRPLGGGASYQHHQQHQHQASKEARTQQQQQQQLPLPNPFGGQP